jgi:hypothetical protein
MFLGLDPAALRLCIPLLYQRPMGRAPRIKKPRPRAWQVEGTEASDPPWQFDPACGEEDPGRAAYHIAQWPGSGVVMLIVFGPCVEHA